MKRPHAVCAAWGLSYWHLWCYIRPCRPVVVFWSLFGRLSTGPGGRLELRHDCLRGHAMDFGVFVDDVPHVCAWIVPLGLPVESGAVRGCCSHRADSPIFFIFWERVGFGGRAWSFGRALRQSLNYRFCPESHLQTTQASAAPATKAL